MSYKAMLKHRVDVMEQTIDLDSGSPSYGWSVVASNVKCFIDLNFVRTGKDQVWTPESGRSTDRVGVAFFMGDAPLKIGQWVKVTKGPSGVFSLESGIDEAWTPHRKHHLEVSIREIPQMLHPNQGGPSPRVVQSVVLTVPVPEPGLDDV